MRFHRIFVLSILTLAAVGLATPHSPHWDDMRSKHSWSVIPEDWECSGPPPTGTTIDLDGAQASLRGRLDSGALPGQHSWASKVCLLCHALSLACTHMSRCSIADIVHIYPGSRSLSLSLRIQTPSSLFMRGSSTTACLPLPSQ
jgi:hypothetical protein